MKNKNNIQENMHGNNAQNRGFASMSHKKIEEIARKGGHASAADKAENKGMARRGSTGGYASGKNKHSHEEEE